MCRKSLVVSLPVVTCSWRAMGVLQMSRALDLLILECDNGENSSGVVGYIGMVKTSIG